MKVKLPYTATFCPSFDAKVAAIKNARNVIDDIHAKAYAIANSIAKLFGGKPTAEQLNDELKKINEIKKIAGRF